MAKLKRKVIGSFLKSNDPTKPNYIQIDKRLTGPITLSPGQTIRAESKKFKLDSLDAAEANGKLSGEMLTNLRENANKMKDFVIAELILLEETND